MMDKLLDMWKILQKNRLLLSTIFGALIVCSLIVHTLFITQDKFEHVKAATTYTICDPGHADAPCDYDTFGDAVTFLNGTTLTESVTFDVSSDTYTETMTINAITGSSATNTVTFQSKTGSNTDVIIQSDPTAGNGIVKFNGADYVTFRNMTLTITAANGSGNTFHVASGSHNITIDNNILNGWDYNTTHVSGGYAVIRVPQSAVTNDLVITNNTMNDGTWGAYLHGISSNKSTGTIVTGNTINAPYYDGIFVGFREGAVVKENVINITADNIGNRYGINTNTATKMEISKNKIWMNQGTGIWFRDSVGTSDDRNLISNNFIRTDDGKGIELSGSDYTDVYYNSVQSTDIALETASTVASGAGARIYNNVLYSTGSFAIDWNLANDISELDFNNLYSEGANLGRKLTTPYATLASWKSGANRDYNSVSVDPAFTSSTDLHTSEVSLQGAALSIYTKVGGSDVLISEDIDGDTRSLGNPDIGADEFSTSLNDPNQPTTPYINNTNAQSGDATPVTLSSTSNVKMSAVYTHPDGTSADKYLVQVATDSTFDMSTILYDSGSGDTNFTNTGTSFGPISSGSRAPDVTLQNLCYGVTNYARIKYFDTNGSASAFSPTVQVTATTPTVTYTIGPGGDYTTINDAVTWLEGSTVNTDIVFEILDGTYSENIEINNLTYCSSKIYDITFQSQSGNDADVIVNGTTNTPSSGTDYIWKFNNTDNITIKNMTITYNGTPTRGRLVHYTNSRNITIESNTINNYDFNVGDSTINLYYPGIYGAINQYSYSIDIKDNTINDGTYGIAHYQNSDGLGNQPSFYTGNTINNANAFGIYVRYIKGGVKINDNIINSGVSEAAGCKGIYSDFNPEPVQIQGNQILTDHCAGIDHRGNWAGDVDNRDLIANNVIRGENGSGIGIFLYGTPNVDVYYNSIYSGGDAFYVRKLGSRGAGQRIHNNTFYSEGGLAFYNLDSSFTALDYNAYYSPSGDVYGYSAARYTTLAAWQAATPDSGGGLGAGNHDQNSLQADPGFTGTGLAFFKSPNTLFNDAGTPVSNTQAAVTNTITSDIDGDTRDGVTPDIGADEFIIGDYPNAPGTLFVNNTTAQSGLTSPATLNSLSTIVFSAVHTDPNSDDAIAYQLQIDDANDFMTIPANCDSGKLDFTDNGLTDVIHNTRSDDLPLPAGCTISEGTTYYWRLKFWDVEDNESAYTSAANFIVITNTAPTAPTDLYANTSGTGAQLGETDPTGLLTTDVVFSAVYTDTDSGDTANKYQLQIATNNTFTNIIYDSGSSGTAITDITEGNRSTDISIPGGTLSGGVLYYWRIKFWDDDDAEGAFSSSGVSAASFSSNGAPTSPTNLFANSSANGAQSGLTNPQNLTSLTSIVFSAIYNDIDSGDDASAYQLVIDDDNSFSSINCDTGKNTFASLFLSNVVDGSRTTNLGLPFGCSLSYETTYYWKIKFWDDQDEEGVYSPDGASAAEFFVKDTTAPVLTSSTPTPGESNVVLDTNIAFVLDEDDTDNATTIINSSTLSVTVGGNTAITGGVCQSGYSCTITPSGTPSGKTLTVSINPNTDLTDSTTYTVNVGVSDTANTPNTLNTSFNFSTIGGPSAPTSLFANTATTGAQSGLTNPTLKSTSVVVSAIHNDGGSLDATGYRLQVATDNNFSTVIYDSGSGSTLLSSNVSTGSRSEDLPISTTLTDNTTYYWKLQFYNSLGAGDFSPDASSAASFTIDLNDIPSTPSSPYVNVASSGAQSGLTDPQTLTSTDVVFSAVFEDVDTGDTTTNYQLVISTENDFSGSVYCDSGMKSLLGVIAGSRTGDIALPANCELEYNTQYYWKVRFWDSEGEASSYSSVATFTVPDIGDPVLSVNSVSNGAINVSPEQNIVFTITDGEAGVNGDSITVTIDGVNYMSNGVCSSNSDCTITQVTNGYQVTINPISILAPSTQVAVVITAEDNAQNSVSESLTFTTAFGVAPRSTARKNTGSATGRGGGGSSSTSSNSNSTFEGSAILDESTSSVEDILGSTNNVGSSQVGNITIPGEGIEQCPAPLLFTRAAPTYATIDLAWRRSMVPGITNQILRVQKEGEPFFDVPLTPYPDRALVYQLEPCTEYSLSIRNEASNGTICELSSDTIIVNTLALPNESCTPPATYDPRIVIPDEDEVGEGQEKSLQPQTPGEGGGQLEDVSLVDFRKGIGDPGGSAGSGWLDPRYFSYLFSGFGGGYGYGGGGTSGGGVSGGGAGGGDGECVLPEVPVRKIIPPKKLITRILQPPLDICVDVTPTFHFCVTAPMPPREEVVWLPGQIITYGVDECTITSEMSDFDPEMVEEETVEFVEDPLDVVIDEELLEGEVLDTFICTITKERAKNSEPAYTDIAGTQHETFARLLLERGIILGTEFDSFNPLIRVTRSEVLRVSMLANCDRFDFDVEIEPPFPDVTEEHPDVEFIQAAKNEGIVNGYLHDGLYRPDIYISRAEVLKIVMEVVLGDLFSTFDGEYEPFTDVEDYMWFENYIKHAYRVKLISDNEIHKYYPFEKANRGYIAEILVKAILLREKIDRENNLNAIL